MKRLYRAEVIKCLGGDIFKEDPDYIFDVDVEIKEEKDV